MKEQAINPIKGRFPEKWRKGPREGVERIEIDTHDEFQVAWGIRRRIRESVHRPLEHLLSGFDIDGLSTRNIHREERVKVQVGVETRLGKSSGPQHFGDN